MIDINKKDLANALLTVIYDSLASIEDINNVCNYQFDTTHLITGHRLKGVVKVEFEEVE